MNLMPQSQPQSQNMGLMPQSQPPPQNMGLIPQSQVAPLYYSQYNPYLNSTFNIPNPSKPFGQVW